MGVQFFDNGGGKRRTGIGWMYAGRGLQPKHYVDAKLQMRTPHCNEPLLKRTKTDGLSKKATPRCLAKAPSKNRVPIVKTCEGRQSLGACQLTGGREDQHNERASHHAL